MKKFAGTFHQNNQGDWVKCITDGGKPCSRHASGEHIKGANLEEALEALHEDDDFGLSDSIPSTPSTSGLHAFIPTLAPKPKEPDDKNHEPTETQIPKKDDKPVAEAVKPPKKPKKTLHKKSPKKPAISKSKAQGVDYDPSSVKVDPKKHQEMLDAMIEEEKGHYHTYTGAPHKAKKGILEYKSPVSRDKHYQKLMKEMDKKKPISIDSSSVYHNDSNATIYSVSNEMFPGVKPSTEMSHHLSEKCEEAWATMTTEQQDAIVSYTGSSYGSINKHLLGKATHCYDIESLEKSINDMHEGLKKSVTDEDMLVYRRRYLGSGPYRSSEELTFYDAVAHDDGTLTRADFCSTTISPDSIGVKEASGNDTSYVIKVPKGTSGIYINDHSEQSSEREFILDKGLKYRVVGIYERGKLQTTSNGHQKWHKPPIIALEVVPDNASKEEQS